MQWIADGKETMMLNPLKDMAPRVVPSEVRRDPLTGRTARICHFMPLKWEKPDFEKLVAGTDRHCPFCPHMVTKVTPCFPPELIPEGRLTADGMVLFPNLAPYDSLSCVATLGRRHYIPMAQIESGRIRAGLNLAMDFFRRVHAADHPESVYHIVNWNYMPPSGSSLIHPHLQVFVTSHAPNLMREELEAARRYLEKEGHNYWDDLVAAEEKGLQRWLGRIGRSAWLSAWAPMGVAGDVLAVVDGATSTLDLTDEDLADISTGLTRVIAAYDQVGIYSFNMNFFTGRPGENSARFHLLFSPRTFFNQALSTPDVGALRNLYNETLCMAYPEEINTMLKAEW